MLIKIPKKPNPTLPIITSHNPPVSLYPNIPSPVMQHLSNIINSSSPTITTPLITFTNSKFILITKFFNQEKLTFIEIEYFI